MTLRVLIFPLNVKARKNAVNMQNNLPQIQLLQLKINEARETGNYYDSKYFEN